MSRQEWTFSRTSRGLVQKGSNVAFVWVRGSAFSAFYHALASHSAQHGFALSCGRDPSFNLPRPNLHA